MNALDSHSPCFVAHGLQTCKPGPPNHLLLCFQVRLQSAAWENPHLLTVRSPMHVWPPDSAGPTRMLRILTGVHGHFPHLIPTQLFNLSCPHQAPHLPCALNHSQQISLSTVLLEATRHKLHQLLPQLQVHLPTIDSVFLLQRRRYLSSISLYSGC